MLKKLNEIKFKYIPVFCIIVYIPFHLLEEALGNFPLWMSEHYSLPKVLSYPHWLINNSIFFLILLIGLLIYFRDRIKFLPFGVGILVWSFMNSMEHLVFSAIDMEASPGIVTAVIFLFVSGLGFIKLRLDNSLNMKLMFKSIIAGICYWVVPIIIIVSIGKYLSVVFP